MVSDSINSSYMQLSSPVFNEGESIPQKYGRDFANVNPPLEISDVPEGAKSFVLILEDPDVPEAAGVPVWIHWVVFNISTDVRSIPEASIPVGVRGKGTRGELEYGGPRPPDREHRYFFKLYALDTLLDLPEGSTKQVVTNASGSHVLATAELMGRYAPQNSEE